jgi:hypothetical protein
MLLDRLPERAALGQLLEAARAGRSGVLVLRGEPGVGKTALLDWAIESAAGLRVARVAGVESEMELAFAALQQLGRGRRRSTDHRSVAFPVIAYPCDCHAASGALVSASGQCQRPAIPPASAPCSPTPPSRAAARR